MFVEQVKRVRKDLGDGSGRGSYRRGAGQVPEGLSLERARRAKNGFQGGMGVEDA